MEKRNLFKFATTRAVLLLVCDASEARSTFNGFLQPLTVEEWQMGAGCYGRDASGQVYFAQEFSDEPAIIKIAGRLVRPRFPGDEFRFDGKVELRAVDTVVRFRRVAGVARLKGMRVTRETVRMSVTHDARTDVRILSIQCAD